MTSFAAEKCSPAIETWQVAGLDITLAAPRKFSFDSHHECRNIKRDDSPTPPVCSLHSAFFTHGLEYLIIGYSFELRSFRQRPKPFRQRPKPFRQRPTGQFANDRC